MIFMVTTSARAIFAENRGWFEIDECALRGEGKASVLQREFGDARLGDVRAGKHVLAPMRRRSGEATAPRHRQRGSSKRCPDLFSYPTSRPMAPALSCGWGGPAGQTPGLARPARACLRGDPDAKDRAWGALGWVTQGHLVDLLADERSSRAASSEPSSGVSRAPISGRIRARSGSQACPRPRMMPWMIFPKATSSA